MSKHKKGHKAEGYKALGAKPHPPKSAEAEANYLKNGGAVYLKKVRR